MSGSPWRRDGSARRPAPSARRTAGSCPRGLAVIIPVLTPLTVWFEDAPGSHDGESAFTLKIAFSEDVDARGGELRNHVLAVSGGRKLSVGRAEGRKDLYEAAIRPKGDGDVTVVTWLNSGPPVRDGGHGVHGGRPGPVQQRHPGGARPGERCIGTAGTRRAGTRRGGEPSRHGSASHHRHGPGSGRR